MGTLYKNNKMFPENAKELLFYADYFNQRLTQFIVNIHPTADAVGDIYYTSNDKLLKLARDYFKEHQDDDS